MKSIRLSSGGIANIPIELYGKEFEFLVGGVSHKCGTFVAEFLSPTIAEIRRRDPNTRCFEIKTPDPSHNFNELLSLPFKSCLKVSRENFDFFVSVSRELGNAELLSHLVSFESQSDAKHLSECESMQEELVRLRCENKRLVDQNTELLRQIDDLKSMSSHLYYGPNQLDGIISDLRRRCGMNPHDFGLIEVVASSRNCAGPEQILDYGWRSAFCTEDQPDSWIMLDMLDNLVSLTHYTLRTIPDQGIFFTRWVIECSNDEFYNDVVVVDERDTDDIGGPGRIKTYPVNSNGAFYRFIRLRHTGVNTLGGRELGLTNIEIFGYVKEAKE